MTVRVGEMITAGTSIVAKGFVSERLPVADYWVWILFPTCIHIGVVVGKWVRRVLRTRRSGQIDGRGLIRSNSGRILVDSPE